MKNISNYLNYLIISLRSFGFKHEAQQVSNLINNAKVRLEQAIKAERVAHSNYTAISSNLIGEPNKHQLDGLMQRWQASKAEVQNARQLLEYYNKPTHSVLEEIDYQSRKPQEPVSNEEWQLLHPIKNK